MARSFSSSKVLSSAIAAAINGRGFSSAARQLIKGGAVPVISAAAAAKKEVVNAEKVAWVPDPRTGCYRPENVANEIDAAELRALLLKKN